MTKHVMLFSICDNTHSCTDEDKLSALTYIMTTQHVWLIDHLEFKV